MHDWGQRSTDDGNRSIDCSRCHKMTEGGWLAISMFPPYREN